MIALLTPLLLSLGPASFVLIMAVVFAETGLLLGLFLPGDSLLFLSGALVASGVIHLPIWLVAIGVFLAAAAGDQVSYLIGHRVGPAMFTRSDSRFFRQEHAVRAGTFFAKHGHIAVIAARFVPVVRTFVPVVAGVGDMPRKRFSAYNLVGALLWGVGIVLAGYLFGGIAAVAVHIELITIAMASVSLIPAALELIRRRRGTRRGDHTGTSPTGVR